MKHVKYYFEITMVNHNDTTEQQDVEEVIQNEESSSDVSQLEQQLQECEAKYKRALADYQNLEKRVQEDRQELIKASNRELLLNFLPVLDTLYLAQQHLQDEGLRVSIDQFLHVLKNEGVVKIDVVDKDFDPTTMEVVTTGEGKQNRVVKEVRSGYMLYDKLLRPAQVIVGNGEEKKEKK
jgi:molecular chaperone GrpE